jgi:ornithine carbamoyltransferase
MKKKDLLSINDLSSIDIHLLLADAVELRAEGWLGMLEKKSLALLFEKPSLRTRLSFEMAMRQLGGQSLYLSPAEVGLGKRETIKDVAQVLSRYVDVLAVRTFSQAVLEELACYASVPVINALSDAEHPCQALGDLLTIMDHKDVLKGLKLAFIGDGNNVARSLALACALVGMDFNIASPEGYKLDEDTLETARCYARQSGSDLQSGSDPRLAAEAADIVYTDTWVSMGQEDENEARLKTFAPYQVNRELMALAKEDAIFMHCLPAHRGQEVTDEVMDSETSVIFEQAENRLHIQKAILAQLLGGTEVRSWR